MKLTVRDRAAPATAAALALLAFVNGCASNPFRTAAPATPLSLQPPPGVAAPAHTLPQAAIAPATPSYADVDGRQAAAALSRSREESQVMQDEITALREQLASTSTQLAQARVTGMPPAPAPAAEGVAAGPKATSPATMKSALAGLSLPDLAPRFDGSVVRIDIPADQLFDDGTANIRPAGAATLTQVSAELDRVYPGHFIGIEGHVDTEPLHNASWTSPHQLTAARAAAVFDFLTTRTSMQERQLFLVAHGSNHPLVSNATAAGRAKNRRIELVVYPEHSAAAD